MKAIKQRLTSSTTALSQVKEASLLANTKIKDDCGLLAKTANTMNPQKPSNITKEGILHHKPQ